MAKFGRFTTWGACARCGDRVAYNTLQRERLTGLLVCGPSSGRPVAYCWDPWPPVLDFQVKPDRSIEPPAEPLPARWGFDDISSAVKGMKMAPDDTTRLAAFLKPPTSVTSTPDAEPFRFVTEWNHTPEGVETIVPQHYDGTFVPSSSVRTVAPPEEFTLAHNDVLSGPPLTANQGI